MMNLSQVITALQQGPRSMVRDEAIRYLKAYDRLHYSCPHHMIVEGEGYYVCSECYHRVEDCARYCQNCGREIDWDHEQS